MNSQSDSQFIAQYSVGMLSMAVRLSRKKLAVSHILCLYQMT